MSLSQNHHRVLSGAIGLGEKQDVHAPHLQATQCLAQLIRNNYPKYARKMMTCQNRYFDCQVELYEITEKLKTKFHWVMYSSL